MAKIYWLKILTADGSYYFEDMRGNEVFRSDGWQAFEKLFPKLKIRRGQKHLVKITPLKNGVKIEIKRQKTDKK